MDFMEGIFMVSAVTIVAIYIKDILNFFSRRK